MRLHVSYFRVANERTYPGRIEIEASRPPYSASDLDTIEAYILSTYIAEPVDGPSDEIIVSSWAVLPMDDVAIDRPFVITEDVVADEDQFKAVDQWLGG